MFVLSPLFPEKKALIIINILNLLGRGIGSPLQHRKRHVCTQFLVMIFAEGLLLVLGFYKHLAVHGI
jgi:hypothetical protein